MFEHSGLQINFEKVTITRRWDTEVAVHQGKLSRDNQDPLSRTGMPHQVFYFYFFWSRFESYLIII